MNWFSDRFNDFVQQEKERTKKRGSPTLARKDSKDATPVAADYMEEVCMVCGKPLGLFAFLLKWKLAHTLLQMANIGIWR